MYFLRDSFCLSTVSLSRQRRNNLDFVYCSLSRDNPQTFGFEFHLRTLPCAFSRRSVNQPVALLLITSFCSYTVLTRPAQPGRNSCSRLQFLAFRLDFIDHVVVPLSFLHSNQPFFIVIFLGLGDLYPSPPRSFFSSPFLTPLLHTSSPGYDWLIKECKNLEILN